MADSITIRCQNLPILFAPKFAFRVKYDSSHFVGSKPEAQKTRQSDSRQATNFEQLSIIFQQLTAILYNHINIDKD